MLPVSVIPGDVYKRQTLAIINPLHIKLNMVGVGLALCSTVLFSIYGVMGKRKCAEYGGAVVT